LEVRVDTGAKTSSLHVDNLVKFQKSNRPWLQFDIHPDVYQIEKPQTAKPFCMICARSSLPTVNQNIATSLNPDYVLEIYYE